VLVTAHCRRRGHVLAELLAVPGGLRVRVPRCGPAAIWRPAAVPPRRAGAGITRTRLVEEPPGRTSYLAMCSCGMHPVSGDDLLRADAAGTKIITLDPVPV
jgi:hypothetical protein